MNAFTQYSAKELPRIEQCLRERTSGLSPYVLPTVLHTIEAGGKRLRPLLTILTARALGYSGDGAYPLACSVELLHAATLLHDDILDKAGIRRGKPTAHTLYGTDHTILAGDVLLALANAIVAEYGDPALTACLSQALLATATGEILEIAHIRDVSLTLGKYLEIITGKTACLIQAACQSGALLAGAAPQVVRAACDFGLNLGIAFQLVDDVLDYTSPQEVSGKPKGSDIREGKLTLPLIFLLENMPGRDKETFTKAFKDNALSPGLLDSILGTVVRDGHATRARDMAAQYLDKAKQSLAALPEAPETILLAQALEGMANREK